MNVGNTLEVKCKPHLGGKPKALYSRNVPVSQKFADAFRAVRKFQDHVRVPD